MITLDHYGMQGQGKTVTEAKRNAGQKIAEALKGDYRPEILEWRGNAILIYRTPDGWRDQTIVDSDGVRSGAVYGGTNYGCTREEVIKRAYAHLAQMGLSVDDPADFAPDFLNKWQAQEYRRYTEFQRRYREARERGLSDCDAHDYAGRNPMRRDLWEVAA